VRGPDSEGVCSAGRWCGCHTIAEHGGERDGTESAGRMLQKIATGQRQRSSPVTGEHGDFFLAVSLVVRAGKR